LFQHLCAPKFGSSSRKEEDPSVSPLDRPILVLTVSLPKRH